MPIFILKKINKIILFQVKFKKITILFPSFFTIFPSVFVLVAKVYKAKCFQIDCH